MSSHRNRVGRRPQFTIRTAFFAILFMALAFGWFASARHSNRTVLRLLAKVRYAEAELQWAQHRAKMAASPREQRDRPPRGVLSRAVLDGMNLRSISITTDKNAFQRASFIDGDLQDATLSGGGASFQGARFDNANLAGAKLTGGASSFQLASFAGADLTGASIQGAGAALQGVTFENATLINARIIGGGASFQMVNLDGAQFQGADLSGLGRLDLESCYFDVPPTYDDRTRFPAGFDPAARRWEHVASSSSKRSDACCIFGTPAGLAIYRAPRSEYPM